MLKSTKAGRDKIMGLTKKGKLGVGAAAFAALAYLVTRGKVVAQGEFTLTNLVVEPSEVEVGNPVRITCIATNIGELKGSKTITLEVT